MGNNKKVFQEAVSELRHFLLGAALVLTLVVVVPALAQDFGGGGGGFSGGGSGAPSGGGSGAPSGGAGAPAGGASFNQGGDQGGGQQGGQQQGGGQLGGEQGGQQQGGQQQGGQLGGQQGGGQQGGLGGLDGDKGFGGKDSFRDKGLTESCPAGETGVPPNCSGVLRGREGAAGSERGAGLESEKGKFPGQGRGVEEGFPGKGKGVEGGFPGRGRGVTGESEFGKEKFGREEFGRVEEGMGRGGLGKEKFGREEFGRVEEGMGRGGLGKEQFGREEFGRVEEEMGRGMKEKFGRQDFESTEPTRAQAPQNFFDPRKEKGFDKDFSKLFGKQPVKPVMQIEVEEDTSVADQAEAFGGFVEQLVAKSKKMSIKSLRQNAVVFYSQVANWAAEEEVEISDQLAELKYAIKKGNKKTLVETLASAWESIQEQVLSGGGGDEVDFEEEEEAF